MEKVIIIGATSGLGQELAKMFVRDGHVIGVTGRREERLLKFKKDFEPSTSEEQIFCQKMDVNSSEAPSELLDLINRMGGVDYLINASGVGHQNPDTDMDIELNTIRTNVLGFTQVIDTVFNYMKMNGGGHIGFISSVASVRGLGVATAYSASKKFQSTYAQALMQLSNMRHLNIGFTEIMPGFVKTDLLDSNKKYPLLMTRDYAAKKIFRALVKKKRRKVVDWRFAILVGLWRCLPSFIWERLSFVKTENKYDDKNSLPKNSSK